MAHFDFIGRYPRLAQLGAGDGYRPGKGIVNLIFEGQANLVEHNGKLIPSLLGTLKDADGWALAGDFGIGGVASLLGVVGYNLTHNSAEGVP